MSNFLGSVQINALFNTVKGFEYTSFEIKCQGKAYLETGDEIVAVDKEGNICSSFLFRFNFKSPNGLESTIEAPSITKATVEYQNVPTALDIAKRTEIIVDKQEQKINSIIKQQTETGEKLTEVEQTVDSISQKVSHIEETTNTIEGNKTIQLGNAIAGELIELHIYGNNDVFSYLAIGDDVTLSDDLYLLGDSIIVVADSKGNSKEYELGIEDVLRQKDDVCDEYVLKEGKAQIIRRINKDGTIKTKETIEDLGTFSIELFDGTNTLSIKNYSTRINAKFAIQNDMTNIYASKVEMNSAIEQTAEKIDINVNKKLEGYSKTTEMNAAINVTANGINQEVKKKVGEDEIVSKINQSAEKILIHADKLDITGKATKFKTEINEKFGPFTQTDIDRVQNILLGKIEATYEDYEKYDINKQGRINSLSLFIVAKAVASGGHYNMKGTFELDPYSSSKSLTIRNENTNLQTVSLSLFGAIFDTIYTDTLQFLRTDNGTSTFHSSGFLINDEEGNSIDLSMDSTKNPTLRLSKKETETRVDAQGIETPKITQTSLVTQKKNLEKMQNKALDILKNIDIYKYNLKSEKDTDKKHIGFVIGDEYKYSKEVTSSDNKGVDNYSFTSLCCKAIQELSQQVDALQDEIKILKEDKYEINKLDK